MISTQTLVILVGLSLALGFMNGFHDAANSIATIVSTRVLKPYHAVLFATFFNIIAAVLFTKFHMKVGLGIIDNQIIDHYVLFGALVGALTWNIIAWIYNVSSSSSQALAGSMMGAAVAKVGFSAVASTGVLKVFVIILISPTVGFILGGTLMLLVNRFLKKRPPAKIEYVFKKLQLLSVACYGLAHGINDAQKSMGIICLLLISMGSMNITNASPATPPNWVIYSCFLSIGIGTVFGGWRIVRGMGQKLANLNPVGGFCAEAALTIIFMLGFSLSASHTIKGSLLGGSGSNYRTLSMSKGLKNTIVWSWLVTIPVTAIVSAGGWYAGHYILI